MFDNNGESGPPYVQLLVMQRIVLKPSSSLEFRWIDFA